MKKISKLLAIAILAANIIMPGYAMAEETENTAVAETVETVEAAEETEQTETAEETDPLQEALKEAIKETDMEQQEITFEGERKSVDSLKIDIDAIPTFTDMPDNWTTESLKRAVANGLLNGDEGKIMPDDNITRAQMAAIIVRAFGADVEADISAFSDVSTDKWYYSEFAKAVNMNAFGGTDDGKLNPENFITYQECFTVVARVFGLKAIKNDKGEEIFDCLNQFTDGEMVDEWAKTYMSKVVGNGYWDGIDNMLKPKDYITRSEFAVLMDNLIKTYIKEPGIYSEIPDGNVLIKAENVILDGVTTDDMIIVGDAVKNEVILNNIDCTSLISLRGGKSVITGSIHHISLLCSGVEADCGRLSKRTGMIYGVKGAKMNLGIMY